VVNEFAKKAGKAAVSPDERVAVIEHKQAGDSAKAAAEADPGRVTGTRDAVLEAHLGDLRSEGRARSLTVPMEGDKRRQPTLWAGGRDPEQSGRDGPTTSTTYNSEADVVTAQKGAFSQLERGESMKVWIDQDLCTGDGLCEEIAPVVFTLLDDGLAYVKESDQVRSEPGR